MSLHVHLTVEAPVNVPGGIGIFLRRHGQMVEVSRDEWDSMYPGCDPVTLEREACETDEVFQANIKHNLGKMASEAGMYEALWRPEEIGITKARGLIEPLSIGLSLMKREPSRFIALNPSNGWGSYDGFVPWIEQYLAACCRWPDADVSVSR